MTIGDLLDRVPGWSGRPRTIEPLEGGITNQNHRVTVDGASFVVRSTGQNTHLLGIDRHHEEQAARQAAALGVGPEVIAFIEPGGALVTRFLEGASPCAAELRAEPLLSQVATILRIVHGGPALDGVFDWHRVPQDYAATARSHGVAVPSSHDRAMVIGNHIRDALAASPEPRCPCHNDLLAANFLHTPEGLRLIDWEYAGMNDAYFDLGNFAVNNELDPDAEVALVEAYFGAVSGQRLARLRLMKIMSDLREGAWGIVQAGVSDLDVDFLSYAETHYDRLLENAGQSGFARLLEDASSDA